MSTVLTVASLAVGGLVALALVTLALLALGLWIRTRRLNNRGLEPDRASVIDTSPIPRIHEKEDT